MSRTRYALVSRFDADRLVVNYFSVEALPYALANGWDLVGIEPDPFEDLDATRRGDEHRWDASLKERR